jgi:hypothetical protein
MPSTNIRNVVKRTLALPVLFARTIGKLGKHRLRTADEVYQFAQLLKLETPVIAAIGSMLALSAVIRGADPARTEPAGVR